MTYKVYGIGAVAVIALIVALAYNPTDTFDLDTEQGFIISTVYQSAQWEEIKKQVENAEETVNIITNSNEITENTNEISALEDRINAISKNVSDLNNRITQQEVVVIPEDEGEIISLLVKDDDNDEEDTFDKGDTIYFHITLDTDESYLYYEIVNDDTNDEVKDKRLNIYDSESFTWVWEIPSNQTVGDYYIEVEVGDDTETVEFEIE
jgi:predicted RND superfamily exporter protein